MTREQLVALEAHLLQQKVEAQARCEEANQALRKAHWDRCARGVELTEADRAWWATRDQLARLDEQEKA